MMTDPETQKVILARPIFAAVMALFGVAAQRRNSEIRTRDDVQEVADAIRTGVTGVGLKKLHAHNPDLPLWLAYTHGISLESGGIGFWGGTRKSIRSLGSIPWILVRGVRSSFINLGLTRYLGVIFEVVAHESDVASSELPTVLSSDFLGIEAAGVGTTEKLAATANDLRSRAAARGTASSSPE